MNILYPFACVLPWIFISSTVQNPKCLRPKEKLVTLVIFLEEALVWETHWGLYWESISGKKKSPHCLGICFFLLLGSLDSHGLQTIAYLLSFFFWSRMLIISKLIFVRVDWTHNLLTLCQLLFLSYLIVLYLIM